MRRDEVRITQPPTLITGRVVKGGQLVGGRNAGEEYPQGGKCAERVVVSGRVIPRGGSHDDCCNSAQVNNQQGPGNISQYNDDSVKRKDEDSQLWTEEETLRIGFWPVVCWF